MAIAPIDLQIMYSQMDNFAQIASKQNVSLLNEAMQQQKIVQQDMEKATTVHEAAREEAKTSDVDKDGKGNLRQDAKNQKNKKKKEEEEDLQLPPAPPMKQSWLGQHVDVIG